MTGTSEEFFPVAGATRYRINRRGIVLGQKGNPLKQKPSPRGYLRVFIRYDDGVKRHRLVHLLVLETFEGERPPDAQTRHWDGDKQNNNRTNLVYGTCLENQEDTIRLGRHRWANRDHCERGHEYTEENTRWSVRPSGGKTRHCRECMRIYRREWLEKNPEKSRQLANARQRRYQERKRDAARIE